MTLEARLEAVKSQLGQCADDRNATADRIVTQIEFAAGLARLEKMPIGNTLPAKPASAWTRS